MKCICSLHEQECSSRKMLEKISGLILIFFTEKQAVGKDTQRDTVNTLLIFHLFSCLPSGSMQENIHDRVKITIVYYANLT